MKYNGNHLIKMGYNPGKWFSDALEYLNNNDLEIQEVRQYLESVKPHIIEPHDRAVEYFKNIKAENEEESINTQAVFNSMDILMKTPTIVSGAVMPDACPTGTPGIIPVGAVVGAKNAIHPAMHSADICCSVMMSSFGFTDPKKVLDAAHSITHFGGGGRKDVLDLPENLEKKIKANYFTNNEKSIHVAKTHLGTQGDGNHFLFVGQSEKTGETIMVTHHGSRGFGAQLYKQGMAEAERYRKLHSPRTFTKNAWIPYEEKEGKEYWEALQIAREWTKLNHTWIHNLTSSRLKKDVVQRFWNEHNFVFKDGDTFFHAKGATPLSNVFVPDSEDGLRLIPLNMSEPVLIVSGESTSSNLGFAPHGAGRNVSRRQHIRKHAGKSIDEIYAEETKGLDIRFYSGNIDISELPSAYKNADNVQAQMEKFNLGKVEDKILPYGCIMAGDWQKDAPWRKKLAKKRK